MIWLALAEVAKEHALVHVDTDSFVLQNVNYLSMAFFTPNLGEFLRLADDIFYQNDFPAP